MLVPSSESRTEYMIGPRLPPLNGASASSPSSPTRPNPVSTPVSASQSSVLPSFQSKSVTWPSRSGSRSRGVPPATGANHQPPLHRVVLVDRRDQRHVLAVGGIADAAQLAPVLHGGEEFAAGRVVDAHALEHVAVVHQGARGDGEGQPRAVRRPVQVKNRALHGEGPRRVRLRVVAAEGGRVGPVEGRHRCDPDLAGAPVLFEDLLLVTLLTSFLAPVALLLERDESDPRRVGRDGVVQQVGVVLEQFARFAAVDRDRPERAVVVTRATRDVGHQFAVGRKTDHRHVDLAGDVSPIFPAGRGDEVQLHPRRSIFLVSGLPGHREGVGDPFAVG